MNLEHKIEADELAIKQILIFIERAQATIKTNFEEDFRIMYSIFNFRSEENAREAK